MGVFFPLSSKLRRVVLSLHSFRTHLCHFSQGVLGWLFFLYCLRLRSGARRLAILPAEHELWRRGIAIHGKT
jgi:hypothetical protein